MKHTLLLIACVCLHLHSKAQHSIKGMVTDTANYPVVYTTVSLLHPEDSTMAYFAVCDKQGIFQIKDVPKGRYLLQAAFMGFKTYYRAVEMPMTGDGSIGKITLRPYANVLEEVSVKTEKIPIRLNGDTLEYNAGSFKTKPDANVEELLKKLPGVQVDKAGNIKAQGEDVQNVLVDGKPFFSNDPKVATKNLPADAINKVQVFNKQSDMAEFTGVDDGSREKTINLQLKDDKKKGYFGDVQAGYGTNNRFDGSGKFYRFKPKSQLAALAMANNINHFGFSFQDYLNFSGGLGSLMQNNGEINMGNDRNMPPVDFGQPIYGLIKSGAGGINYGLEPKKGRRLVVSYLGNASDKTLTEKSSSENFTDQGSFSRNGTDNEKNENIAHRVSVESRITKDSFYRLNFAANASLINGHSNISRYTATLLRDTLINTLDRTAYDNGQSINTNARLSYMRNSRNKKQVYRISANGEYNKELNNSQWNNITRLIPASLTQTDNQRRNDMAEELEYAATASFSQSLGKGYYVEPSLSASNNNQSLTRQQKIIAKQDVLIDSLSPRFERSYTSITHGIGLRHSTKATQWGIGLSGSHNVLARQLNGTSVGQDDYTFLLPQANMQHQFGQGNRVEAYYRTAVSAPSAGRLMPVADYTNPLQISTGNNLLRPEYTHSGGLNWIWFDQFTFSSLFANIGGRYTTDKISLARTIGADLVQRIAPVNVPYEYMLNGRIQYGRPVRKLGISVNASFDESYRNSINIINTVDNKVSTFNHVFELSFSNTKNEKWDVNMGGNIAITDSRFTINKEFDNHFYTLTGFSQISFRPNTHWHFRVSADVSQYRGRNFNGNVFVPLLQSEASYYFMKANRAIITLSGFDLLNANTGIQRVSNINSLSEVQSNIIQQYFMLSFKYRLNYTGSAPGGQISVKTR